MLEWVKNLSSRYRLRRWSHLRHRLSWLNEALAKMDEDLFPEDCYVLRQERTRVVKELEKLETKERRVRA